MDPYQRMILNRQMAGTSNYEARENMSGGGRRLGDGDEVTPNRQERSEFAIHLPTEYRGEFQSHLHTTRTIFPKRKLQESEVSLTKTDKTKSSAVYMSTLFKDGTYSDVCIEFIAPQFQANKIMRLHKTILCQSAYFEALFNASWKEANQEVIKITITDNNITERSIDIVFESFYTSQITYDHNDEDLISILATARMFTADEVAELCAKELYSIVKMNNIIYSYYAFTSYGFSNESYEVFKYMLRNFSWWYTLETESFLQDVLKIVEQPLFEKLVRDNDFVVQDEYMLYDLIKKWMIENLKEEKDCDDCRILERLDKTPFLLTADGEPYVKLFKAVRLSNIMDVKDLETLQNDNIIPFEWIEEAGAVSLAQMMVISIGARGSVLPNFPEDSFRVGIFHSDISTLFVDKLVNFCGIHLRFRWSKGILSVHRYRHTSETIFNHGTVSLQLRITFFTPKGYTHKLPCDTVLTVKITISENNTINLFGREGNAVSSYYSYLHTFCSESLFGDYDKVMFASIIGIDLIYFGAPKDELYLQNL